jgi:hypothetical protein
MSLASGWIALQMGLFDRAGGLRWATESRIKICSEFLQSCSSLGIMMGKIGSKDLLYQTKPGGI